jgi:DNA repair protein RadC
MTVKLPNQAVDVIKKRIGNKDQEHCVVLTLNGAREPISMNITAIGLVNRCLVHPRETFRQAIKDNASTIIFAHNHPSGALDFSEEDRSVAKRLKECGELLGIGLLDSIVVSKKGYASMLEQGIL